jgi:hypothetical protein
MIEGRRIPVGGGMALRTIVAEIACHMIRICCLLEIHLMTLVAIRVVQLVVATGMASLALGCNVSASQDKERCRMVEC